MLHAEHLKRLNKIIRIDYKVLSDRKGWTHELYLSEPEIIAMQNKYGSIQNDIEKTISDKITIIDTIKL